MATKEAKAKLDDLADLAAAAIAAKSPPPLPDPIEWIEAAGDFLADEWQERIILDGSPRLAIAAPRQSGKSFVIAGRTAYEASYMAEEIVIIAPTFRQGKLLADKIADFLRNGGIQHEALRNVITTEKSTVTVLPGDRPDVVRGFTASKLIIDEAAFVRSDLLSVVLPMLGSRSADARLVMISTPSGKSGAFYNFWSDPSTATIRVQATEINRFTGAYLAEVKARLGDHQYRQEMLAEFIASSGGLFSAEMLKSMFGDDEGEETHDRGYSFSSAVSADEEDRRRQDHEAHARKMRERRQQQLQGAF